MRKLSVFTSIILSLFLVVTATAQVRGRGRLQGTVTDKTTGKPIQDATVTVAIASGNTQPIIVKTDAHGHWSALGMVGGQWNVDIVAAGYATSRGTANISEMQQQPMIQTQLAPEVKEEAAADTVTAAPLVSKEAVEAITEGQNLMRIKAGDVVPTPQSAGGAATHTVTADEVHENVKRAVADFEKALPMVPADKPETKQMHDQLLQVMAQAYYRAGDLKNAISSLEAVTAADPSNNTAALLLANLYLENGQLDAGKAQIEKLPASAITDPTTYLNLGILFFNKKNAGDAVTYFSKAIAMDPKGVDAFYYRGLANAQLNKTAEARADFEQVIAMAPDATEAKDARSMLAALPKK
ncbi:MAG TPA: tetratricopeptide repeat protein [Thermoanaerobaculia bacterium]|nr:tetratricopeptide repeat protein [Thermoanaerobaculia bacterium]